MTEMNKFSIVIPCFNEKNYISRCIDSILDQDYDKSLIEIVIVDGLSDDGTRDIIGDYRKKFPNIKMYDNEIKKTPRSLNIGITNATGDVVVILGAHTRIEKDFVRLNNKFLNEKNVKVTGGTQINVGDTFTQALIGTAMAMPFAMASATYRWSKKEQFVDTVVYAAYKKELFDKVGLFEENYAISEDAEINWRIRNAGYKIFFSPQIKTYYYPRRTIKTFLKQMFRYGILRVNVLKKHLNATKLVHVTPPLFVLFLLALIVLSFFSGWALYILIGTLALHVLISLFTSLPALGKGKLKYLAFLPFLSLSMHIAWGAGFISGLLLPKSDRW